MQDKHDASKPPQAGKREAATTIESDGDSLVEEECGDEEKREESSSTQIVTDTSSEASAARQAPNNGGSNSQLYQNRPARKMQRIQEYETSSTGGMTDANGEVQESAPSAYAAPGDALAVASLAGHVSTTTVASEKRMPGAVNSTVEERSMHSISRLTEKHSIANHQSSKAAAAAAGNDQDEIKPGAFATQGRAFGDIPSWSRQPMPRPRRRGSSSGSFAATLFPSLAAVLVQQQDEESDLVCVEATPIPQGNHVRDKRLLIIGIVLLVIVVGIVIAVTVPLSLKSGDHETAVVETEPSASMSASPTLQPSQAPVIPITITVVIQLDDKPEETGWSLKCGSQMLVGVPPTMYRGQANRKVAVSAIVGLGEECRVIVFDAGGDGIDNGSLALCFGHDLADASARFVEERLNFTESMEYSFTAESPPTIAPTTSPAPTSQIPTGSIPITVFIQFDQFPSENSWRLECNGIVYRTAEKGSYSIANQNATETFHVEEGALCQFIIEDLYGDGMCCFNGFGFYQIFLGEGTGGETAILVDGDGEFGSRAQINFTALPMAPTVSPAPP